VTSWRFAHVAQSGRSASGQQTRPWSNDNACHPERR